MAYFREQYAILGAALDSRESASQPSFRRREEISAAIQKLKSNGILQPRTAIESFTDALNCAGDAVQRAAEVLNPKKFESERTLLLSPAQGRDTPMIYANTPTKTEVEGATFSNGIETEGWWRAHWVVAAFSGLVCGVLVLMAGWIWVDQSIRQTGMLSAGLAVVTFLIVLYLDPETWYRRFAFICLFACVGTSKFGFSVIGLAASPIEVGFGAEAGAIAPFVFGALGVTALVLDYLTRRNPR
ncbi:hypothetical protein [Antarctobacter heliothermus]|uniref:Uncharacterized protein n=1 Tax=Antarctobacter heliothermus TaxID=74033 RepID=A0A239CYE6_9RHOB|nr:hypothetical protein [Antarctobacter heliothermus]SNS25067.1 hypothetical protein SAMN04488078_1008110 [Antarctobacter heliothermus]